MKICIMAFDGLEYTLVKRYKIILRSLAQRRFRKYPSNLNLNSVQLWSMFLTGKSVVEEDDFVYKRKYASIVPHAIRKYFRVISKKFPWLVLRPPKVKGNTIFDLAKKPLPYNVFCYNETKESFEYRVKNSLTRTLDLPLEERRKIVQGRVKVERKLFNNFLKLLKERDWDLAMFYARFIDDAGHLICRSIEESLKYHIIADKWVKELKEILDNETLLLVVSDHGILYGKHTPYAFYSVNKDIELKVNSICDFYEIIKSLLNQ